MVPPYQRHREITDALGARLRICIDANASATLVTLEQPDARGRPRATLGAEGTEVLWGYILSAQQALPHGLDDERVADDFPFRLQLRLRPTAALGITQPQLERPFAIPATFWDRLYAELCLFVAHSRQLDGAAEAFA